MSTLVSTIKEITSKNINLNNPPIIAFALISDLAVATLDLWNEIDVFFDHNGYEFIDPKAFDKEATYPRSFAEHNLGILPGIGNAPRINNFEKALEYAKRNLKPKIKEAEFYDKPKVIS